MAVEIAGTFLHWSQPPPPRGSISHNTVTLAISSLLYTTSRNSLIHKTVHHSPFLGAALLNHSHRRESGRGRGGRRWRGSDSSSASLDDFVEGGKNEEKFVKRPDELNLNFDIEFEFQRNRDAETSNRCDESSPSPSRDEIPSISPASDLNPALPISANPEIRFSDQIPAFPISIYPEIPAMPPESWSDADEFELEELERISNSFDLPLSLRILKRKNNRWESTETAEDSAYSSVKRAFSSMVFIVRELQIHAIRMREALFSFDNFQIQGILARVHDELHASFVWLFHRIFSSTPTLMVYLMLLLANFTVFSITDQHAIAATPLLPLQSVSTVIEESSNNFTKQFDASAIKTFSNGRSAVVGGSGIGGGKPPAISGAADDGYLDRSSSSLCYGGAISPSIEAIDEDTAAMAWKRILKEAETIRASGRHEALMDSQTLQRFVSPVTVEAELEDLSVYSATELSYLISLADNPDDVLLLSNFAQFLYTVFRDHDRAEEYFKRALRAEPVDAETLNRYANFLWVARKDLGAAEETFLEAISADPQNTYYSANYAHFLWSTGGHDTCYPLGDCGVDDT